MSSELNEIFGDVIFTYSREQAHEDGVLLDVSDTEGAKLFKFPVSITGNLSATLAKGHGAEPETFQARLWDVLYMGTLASKRANGGDPDVFYTVRVGNRNVRVWANCEPDDTGAPCRTFGLPEDR